MPSTREMLLRVRESNTPYSPIPADNYTLHISDAEMEPARERQDGQGMVPVRVRVTFRVVDPDGSYDARMLWHRFTMDASSGQFGFAKGLFRRITGQNLEDAIEGDEIDDEELGTLFASGIAGGTVLARVKQRPTRATRDSDIKEYENVVDRWIDAE